MSADVSIIIPTYNGREFIEKTINSCLEQTYKSIDIIVIDDGSTDGTRDILSSYKDQVSLIFNVQNLFLVPNRCRGLLGACKGSPRVRR